RSVFRSIKAETERQIKLYENGDTVKQATLGWDEDKQRLIIQRYKERADEYRYFPEPDLPVLEMNLEYIEDVRTKLPELPDAKRERFEKALGLNHYDELVLGVDRAVSAYYEDVLAAGANPKSAANWMITNLFSVMNGAGVDRENIARTKVSAKQFAELVKLVDGGKINKGTA